MSIAVLNQVYDEARRLAVAGSVVARGDFRLKKLLPPLEQAGAKASVFAKVAEHAKAVIDGPEETAAENLLELTSLVTAVLYTQGETGMPGTLEPIETTDLGGTTAQTSARLLKPLLEALSSTGSGRLELVKDAHQRGAFRDLRLVKPALNALDDPYPEIAEFIAEQVLPMFGQAILSELRAKYDPKGMKGHPRRLKLMHTLDPAGSRELVLAALEGGSKEVKVAAITCLNSAKEDLAFLIEQAGAKAQDVRAAAYQALAAIDDPAAVAVLEKALNGKDLQSASQAIHHTNAAHLPALVLGEIQKGLAGLFALKDKKAISEAIQRLCRLVFTLPRRDHADTDALLLDLFARREKIAAVKGATQSGPDLVNEVVRRMAIGSKAVQQTLARAHADLDADGLSLAIDAARASLAAAEVYDLFSPYLTLATGGRKKGADAEKRDAIVEMLGGDTVYRYRHRSEKFPPLDPRWLDLAVQLKHLGLIHAVGRPGHAGAEAFALAEFDERMKKAKKSEEFQEVVTVLVHLHHPKATDALIASLEKTIGKANVYTYWYYQLIPELPKAAIPKLEAIVPKLKDRETDQWLRAIEELRNKP